MLLNSRNKLFFCRASYTSLATKVLTLMVKGYSSTLTVAFQAKYKIEMT